MADIELSEATGTIVRLVCERVCEQTREWYYNRATKRGDHIETVQ